MGRTKTGSRLGRQVSLHLHCVLGFGPSKDSHASCTPWSVFQDGSDEAIPLPTTTAHMVTHLPPEQKRTSTGTAGSPLLRLPNGQKRPSPCGACADLCQGGTSPRQLATKPVGGSKFSNDPKATEGTYPPALYWPPATLVGQLQDGNAEGSTVKRGGALLRVDPHKKADHPP